MPSGSYNSPSRFIIVSRPHNADTEPMRNPTSYLEARLRIVEGQLWWVRLWMGASMGIIAALVFGLILWAKYIPKQ